MRLVISDLSLRYGDRTVFDRARLDLRGPSLAVLMGPSGSGKSSLLAYVAGLLKPQNGLIAVDEHPPDPRELTWILQSSPLLARRTALDNVILGPLARGHEREESRALARRALEELSIGQFADAPIRVLSGGERQRVSVARSLASGAAIVLADEPTASLDAAARDTVCQSLLKLREHGALVIVATHDPYLRRYADTAIDVQDGQLRAA